MFSESLISTEVDVMFSLLELSTEKISASSVNICCTAVLSFGVKPDKLISSNTLIWCWLISNSEITCCCFFFGVHSMCSLICVNC